MNRRGFLKVVAGGIASLTVPIVALPVLKSPMRIVTFRGLVPGTCVSICNANTMERYWVGTTTGDTMVAELPDEDLPVTILMRKGGSAPYYKPLAINADSSVAEMMVQQVEEDGII